MNWDVQSERQLFGHHSIPHSLPVSFVYTTIRKNLFWVVINFIFHAVPPYRRLYYSKQAALSRGVCFSQSVLPEALGDRVLFYRARPPYDSLRSREILRMSVQDCSRRVRSAITKRPVPAHRIHNKKNWIERGGSFMELELLSNVRGVIAVMGVASNVLKKSRVTTTYGYAHCVLYALMPPSWRARNAPDKILRKCNISRTDGLFAPSKYQNNTSQGDNFVDNAIRATSLTACTLQDARRRKDRQ